MLYRLTRRTPLSTGQKYGDIIREGDLSARVLRIMLETGTLIRVSTPPLSELPGWERRSDVLARAGVSTVEELIQAQPEEIAAKVKKSARTIRRWQEESAKFIKSNSQSND